MDQPTVRLKIHYVEKDFRRYVFLKARKVLGWQLFVDFLLLALIYIAAARNFSGVPDEGFRMFAALFFICAPFIQSSWGFWYYHRLLRTAVTNYNGEFFEISSAGVGLIGNGRTARYEWKRFSDFVEYDDRFFLMPNAELGAVSITLIPKRWFETDDKLATFRGIVSAALVNGKAEPESGEK